MNTSMLRQIAPYSKQTSRPNISKQFFCIFLSIILCTNSATSIVFAEDSAPTEAKCQACTTSSPYLDNYISFGLEIIKTLQTYANKETPSVMQAQAEPGKADYQKELSSIADSLNKKAQTVASAWYAASLITIEGALLDSWKSIWPMLHSQSIMRDWKKLDALDQSITNTLFDLWNAGVFIRLGFKEWLDERLESIAKKYSQWANPVLSINSSSQPGVFRGEQPIAWIGALWRMNQAMKTNIGTSLNGLDQTYLNGKLSFSQDMRDSIQGTDTTDGYYSCAKWTPWLVACSKSWKTARDNISSISTDFKNQAKDARKTIQNAMKRLSWFWSKNGDAKQALQDRSRDLMRSQYGLDGVNATKNKWVLKNNADAFANAWKSVRNDITQTSPIAWLSDIVAPPSDPPFIIGDLATAYTQRAEQNIFLETMRETIKHARVSYQQTTFGEVSAITKLFPDLSKSIIASTYMIDSSQEKTIVKNLGRACELQCSNAWWTCRAP